MRLLLYYLSLVLALPCAAFALGIVVLNHVIETRNLFKIIYHLILAYAWGVPAIAVLLALLLAAGLFTEVRLVASFILIALNLAALVIILISPAVRSVSDTFFLLPTVASALLACFLVVDYFRSPLTDSKPPAETITPGSPV